MGASPATGPTPNRGFEAAGLQRLGVVIKQLEQLIPMLGSGSDPGKDVLKALNMLSKHVPSGSVTPANERNVLQNAQMKNAQNNQAMQQMRQRQAQGGAPGGAQPGAAA